jgi:hypothetical protein
VRPSDCSSTISSRYARVAGGYIGPMTEREQPPTDAGQGYPEDSQPGTGIDPQQHPENEVAEDDGPETSTADDGDPGQATGNPKAAGG